jgi:hypothetical protein
MSTSEILQEINQLSHSEKLFVIEKILKDLSKNSFSQQITIASEALESEYRSNQELTAFSTIDWDDFYEAK